MLNFLRQEIAKKEQERQKAFHAQEDAPIQEMDEAILECAHLFSEMEELTIVGTNAQRERPVIDIPIEDDIELDLVEMDVKTGRIVDIPMDVQTSEAFEQERTYDDFYQEAMARTPMFNRESRESYLKRVQEVAMKAYEKYHAYIVQEGLFGNDMMSVSDERVPSNVMVDLGPLHEGGSSRHYVAKLPVYFETTPDHKISMNQIHALSVASNLEAFEHMGEALRGLLIRDGYRRELYRSEIWDIATPRRVIVPAVMDKFVVGIEFDVEGMRRPYPVMWSVETRLVRQSKGGKIENKEELMKKLEGSENNTYPNIKVANKDFNAMNLVCKKDFKAKEEKAIKEAFDFTPNRWLGNSAFFQEAIDFGGGDPSGDPPPLGGDPNAAAGGGTDPAAAPAGGDPMGGADPTAGAAPDPNAGADPNAAGGASPDASTATTNDISQQIADNVANATAANQAAASQTDVMNQNPTFDQNVDDTFAGLDNAMGGTDNPDMGNMDAPTSDASGMDLGNTTDTSTTPTDPTDPASSLDDIETDIDDTSSTSSTDTDGNAEMGNMDIDNMSMDDMIQQGIEKIKTMPMGQLKEFLNDGSGAIGTTPTDTNDDLSALEYTIDDLTNDEMEMVLETAGSLSKQVNICVRKVLGDLNDNKVSLQEIFHNVKRDSKHLNNTVVKAVKSAEFDKTAKRELENLNHALNELVLKLNDNPMKEEIAGIKEAIKNFTGATRRVSKVVDLGAAVTQEYYLWDYVDNEEYVQESVNSRILGNTLWAWILGVWTVDEKNIGEEHKLTNIFIKYKWSPIKVILTLATIVTGGAFDFARQIAGIIDGVRLYKLSTECIEKIAAVELTKDITEVSQTIWKETNGDPTSVLPQFQKKLDALIKDSNTTLKHLAKNINAQNFNADLETQKKLYKVLVPLRETAMKARSISSNMQGTGGAAVLKKLVMQMAAVMNVLTDVKKINAKYKIDPNIEATANATPEQLREACDEHMSKSSGKKVKTNK